jgi:hypothetical protein
MSVIRDWFLVIGMLAGAFVFLPWLIMVSYYENMTKLEALLVILGINFIVVVLFLLNAVIFTIFSYRWLPTGLP